MQLIADAAATLGGRFNLLFHPHARALYQHALGPFPGKALDLTVGVKAGDGTVWALPFCPQAQDFPYVEQFDTLTSIRYRAVHPGVGVELTMEVRAPFYPRDVRLSTAPFYYLDIRVKRLEAFRHVQPDSPLKRGEIVFELAGEGVEFDRVEGGFRYRFRDGSENPPDAEPLGIDLTSWVESEEAEPFGDAGLRRKFDLEVNGGARMRLIWSNWVEEPVLHVFDEPTTLRYLESFDSREELVAWARGERDSILQRCGFLDSVFRSWSFGTAASDLSALALHSFLSNTWWTRRKDGSDWFSVWEGRCYFHSTVDVEYNDALIYFALWPELLEMLLDEWVEFEMDGVDVLGAEGKGTAFLCHDMGVGHVVGRQGYHHHMPVEESVNYLLLLAAWTAFTGKAKKAAQKLPFCRRLGEFLVKSDTTGNGVPDAGTANTIDDASPAVQYGREQVYLAVKTQAALWALAELEEKCGEKESRAERWRAFASKSIKTIDQQAWLEDHYAVTLTRTTEGLEDPWTGEALEAGELSGWDDHTIYTANGLLYLFLAGVRMPRWRLGRMARDLENATRATMTAYGCRHSSTGDRIVWFSQNMWRDYVAAYLQIDMLSNVERYWDYQLTTGGQESGSLYYDTTEQNYLAYYPRGATVFGMALCAAGMSLDRLEGQLTLKPLRSTLRVPLLPLADWRQMRVPVLTVKTRQGATSARISEQDLLGDLTVTVVGPELEPE